VRERARPRQLSGSRLTGRRLSRSLSSSSVQRARKRGGSPSEHGKSGKQMAGKTAKSPKQDDGKLKKDKSSTRQGAVEFYAASQQ